jgi:hypothetical protein
MENFKSIFRETAAILTWSYLLIKLAVFDLDIYLINIYAPSFNWLLDYKLFAFLSIISILWIIIGKKNFPIFFAYIMGYPFIILLWKAPKLLFKKWSAAFILITTLFEVIADFRFYFITFTLSLVSASSILSPNTHLYLILASMMMLLIFLFASLVYQFKKSLQIISLL